MTKGSYVTEGIQFIPPFHTTVMLHDRGTLKPILGSLLSTDPILQHPIYAARNLTIWLQ